MKSLEKSILKQLKCSQYGIIPVKSFNLSTTFGNIYQLVNHYYFGKADYHGNRAYWQKVLALVSKCTWETKLSQVIFKSHYYVQVKRWLKSIGDHKYVDLMHDFLDIGHTIYWQLVFIIWVVKILLSHSTTQLVLFMQIVKTSLVR